ncbi:hypothetical protein [Methylorubrum sp. GM97]|uniref:hypothetical protein n=1 Tax=Methylorubrum sp. GM97 TaxID=2938232 RepID=UPI0021C32354|nr:hypothetical protein [Methylorubrum sp. GM97]
MSAFVPPPSRRALTTLLGEVAWSAEIEPGNEPTFVERALRDLLDALAAHEAALVELDRLEDAVVAAHGYPRVPLPADLASPGLAYAADPRTIERRLGHGLQARRLKAELRRRQAVTNERGAKQQLWIKHPAPASHLQRTISAGERLDDIADSGHCAAEYQHAGHQRERSALRWREGNHRGRAVPRRRQPGRGQLDQIKD